MREFIFLFLFGAVTIASLKLAGFWGWFAYRRCKSVGCASPIIRDRYFVLALAIALDAVGTFAYAGTRVIANIHYGLSRALHGAEGYGVAAGLVAVLASKTMLVWLADLENDPPRWTFLRTLIMATIIWGIATVFISAAIPHMDFRPVN
jgi:hypothetical protein